MDKFSVILLVVTGASLSAGACLLGFFFSRRKSPSHIPYKYPVSDEDPPAQTTVLEEEPAGYNNAEKKAGLLMEQFKVLMAEKKPFLNTKLTIDELAGYLGTNKTTLSKMINDRFGMNFRQLLNSYRVKEAIDLFAANNQMGLEELRMASGFKSVSTFTSSFSRFTGYTPAEYCKKVAGR